MRPGVRLGIDVGRVRIGVAVCDPAGVLATPLRTVPVVDRNPAAAIGLLVALATQHAVMEIVIGLPRSLSGGDGPAALHARDFGTRLAAAAAPLPVRLLDERLSTVTAERGLREVGRPGARHGAKRRKVIDQAAAVIILQTALDTERTRGAAPGELVGSPPDEHRSLGE
ncbi:MAG: Holliday junction resolvase RuvX [Nocardioidaceae bacterium]|nr:Holliday junction resolvase RuvX [Nocardioidaceae bacterium]